MSTLLMYGNFLVFTAFWNSMLIYPSHFIEEETGSERLSNLTPVTELKVQKTRFGFRPFDDQGLSLEPGVIILYISEGCCEY